VLAVVIVGFVPGDAFAHALGECRASPSGLPWTFEPWEIGSLVFSAGLYAAGLLRLWMRAGIGRGVRLAQATAFFLGLLAIVVALVSPLDALGESLFSAHMIEHELLMMVAAPLLVLGRPLAVWVCAIPESWRREIGGFFHRPAWRGPWLAFTGVWCAWVLHALALWLWHVPAFFEAALENDAVHAFQHICFLGTALVFWWSVLGGATRRARGIALLSIFTTMVHTGILGALLTLSNTVWYWSYAVGSPTWGLTGLEDQQLGGIIMWVPAGLIYVVCGLLLSYRWLSTSSGTHSYP
jgi:putative membrane protein